VRAVAILTTMTPPDECPPTSESQQESKQESKQAAPSSQVPWGTLCVKCGYLLDGLREKDVCPECGSPCERSMESEIFASIWRNSAEAVCRGCGLIVWGVLLWVAAPMAFIVILILLYSSATVGSTLLLVTVLPMLIIGSGLIAAGQWKALADPFHDPSLDPARRWISRARATIFIREALFVISVAVVIASPRTRNYFFFPGDYLVMGWLVASMCSHYLYHHLWTLRSATIRKPELSRVMRETKAFVLFGTLLTPFLPILPLLILIWIARSADRMSRIFRKRAPI
jgi:hypothetical protein